MGKYRFDEKYFAKAPTVNFHLHDNYEIYYFLMGDANYYVEGNIYTLEKGDILLTNDKELHAPVFHNKDGYERIFISVPKDYLSEFVTDTFHPMDCFEKRRLGEKNKIDHRLVKACGIDKHIAEIKKYSTEEMPESEAMIKCHLMLMLHAFHEILQISDETGGRQGKMQAVVEYINKHLEDDLSLTQLGKVFYLNKYYLAHCFKNETGFTIGDYIAKKRILLARELLSEGKSSLEVAGRVGYSEYSSFYRAFKKITGKSPRALKK